MADRKLNEVPVVNDISHLLGVRSNGEIIRISKVTWHQSWEN